MLKQGTERDDGRTPQNSLPPELIGVPPAILEVIPFPKPGVPLPGTLWSSRVAEVLQRGTGAVAGGGHTARHAQRFPHLRGMNLQAP